MHRKAHRRSSLRRLLCTLAVLAGACEDASGPSEPPSPPPPTEPRSVAFTVNTSEPGPRIGADFLGLGFEMPVMADPALTSNAALERLLANLGAGTLRLGGNSVE